VTASPDAVVVIPTRDRPADLRRALAALERQASPRPWELVVVDDGSMPPATAPGATVMRLRGGGPGPARNAGWRSARAPVVLFTDDDCEADPGWIESALDFLDAHPNHVGVEGPTVSPPYDPLSAYSIEVEAPGAYYSCNIAYRREALERLGGFAGDIPTPHGEDVDLAFRALELGPIGWADGMRVRHHPRQLSFRALAARSRMAASEVVVFRRHRSRYGRAAKLPAFLFPYANIAVVWWRLARSEFATGKHTPARLLRLVALPLAQGWFTTRALVAFAWGRHDP
jgi:glycosyltransferase involved in cell wall biosynthesis